jgi:hypothetical protein
VKLADDHFSLCHFAEDVYREPLQRAAAPVQA